MPDRCRNNGQGISTATIDPTLYWNKFLQRVQTLLLLMLVNEHLPQLLWDKNILVKVPMEWCQLPRISRTSLNVSSKFLDAETS